MKIVKCRMSYTHTGNHPRSTLDECRRGGVGWNKRTTKTVYTTKNYYVEKSVGLQHFSIS